MAKLVSKTYGDALFEVAAESGRLDEFCKEAEGALSVLKEHAELFKLMNHPKIVKEEKMQIIENVFKGRISDELTGLLRMLAEKGRFNDARPVLAYFVAEVKDLRQIGIAYVTTAFELSGEQKEKITEKLVSTTKYAEFEMHYDVDADLIGGIVIRIGDRVVDGSIRTKLSNLSRELSKIQLKAGEFAT